MMNQIDPTYLRAVRDGLENGKIVRDNFNSLPDGIVGLFDHDLFPLTMNSKEKRELLDFFLPFAIAQRPISLDFAAAILGKTWSTSKIQAFFQKYVKRFSSAGDGKYSLYHDRFRVYVLQRVSQNDLVKATSDLIEVLNNIVYFDLQEVEIYKINNLLIHYNFLALSFPDYTRKIIDLLLDETFIKKQILNEISFVEIHSGISHCLDLAAKTENWELLSAVTKSVSIFNNLKAEQISLDLLNPETEWDTLFRYFNEKTHNSEKVRMLFLCCILDRDFSNIQFLKMCEEIVEIVEEEYVDLAEIAPIWLIEKVKKIAKKATLLKNFFNEADGSELIKLNKLNPELVYLTESLKDYAKDYKDGYESILKNLKSEKELLAADFDNFFKSISDNNLIAKDEILARITDELLSNHIGKSNTLNWFYWLLSESKFEKGHHSQDLINSSLLCLRFIQKCDLHQLDSMYIHFNRFQLDYFSRIKIANYISEKYFNSNNQERANSIICQIKNTENKFESSAWIKSWILKDITKRKKWVYKLDTHDYLSVIFSDFIIKKEVSIDSFIEDELFKSLNNLDKVSKAEYLAEFAVKFKIKNLSLSQYLIELAWSIIQKPKEWGEYLAKLGVFASSLDIMNSEWVENAFLGIKKDIKKFQDEEGFYDYLSVTLLTTEANRFGNSGNFQIIKEKFKKINDYLKSEFEDLYESAQIMSDFRCMLVQNLNNYRSIRAFWKNEKKYFKKGSVGEYFNGFWNFITDNTSLFDEFNAEDLRIVNLISNKINERFPFERFFSKNSKISDSADRFIIPDIHHLGFAEGIKSMVLLKNNLAQNILSDDVAKRKSIYEEDCNTILQASLDASAKRLDNYDFMNEEIQPFTFAVNKCLAFNDTIQMLNEYLELKESLK